MLVEVLQPGQTAIGVAISIPFTQTQEFANFANPKLGRFRQYVSWKYGQVDGDRICLSATVIKSWQAEFLTLLEKIANEYLAAREL